MKHISFYQWLINQNANTQERRSGEYHFECASRGFEKLDNGDAEACVWCGDEDKLEVLRREYEAQKIIDDQRMRMSKLQ